jgi:intracellular multiplication protein IcmE
MTDDNNDDDLKGAGVPPGDFDNNDFDDFDTGMKAGTLADLWHNNPLVKVIALVVGLILVIGLMIMFGARAPRVPTSSVGAASNLKSVPGTQEVSAVYEKAVQDVNQATVEEAEKTGKSAIPIPTTPPKQPVNLPDDQAQAEDPLARWRRIQEERTQREHLQRPATPQDDNAQAVKTLAQAMAKQMGSILKNLKPMEPQYKVVTQPKEWQEEQDKKASDAAASAAAAGQTAALAANAAKTVEIIVPAGQIAYAQLITQANTDAPGPVLAEVMSGPLTGDRILGSFKSTDDYLILTFDTIVIDGVSYSIDAIALDPNTANPGMVSDIDHRYMERVILPAAAAFIEGLGSAIADNGNTGVTVSGDTVISSTSKLDTKQQIYKGVEKGASKLGDILDKNAGSTKPLITVDSGTTMGILFTEPVTKDLNDPSQPVVQSSALR